MSTPDSFADGTATDVIDRSAAPEASTSETRTDRRKPSLRSFIYGAFNPRRRRIRREEDVNHAFIDWHPRHLLVVSTLIMLLSVVDGLFTTRLINAGLQELNPVLAPLIHGDPVIFALIKIAFTAIGVTALVITAQARIWGSFPVVRVFYGLFIAYACVIVYELYLLQFI